MDVIIRIVQVIIALSILIIVHEFGHFIFARIFKIRVEKFYLFFPPAIFKFKPKNSDTEFGIGCIPLGGFCKISGMVDESLDKETMSKPPQPYEFRSKPAWQRLIVMFGGVFNNFLLAIILFSALLFTWGEEYLVNSDAKYGIVTNQLSHEIGFRTGDKILSFDDASQIDVDFNQLQVNLARSQAKQATVLRGNDTVTIEIDPAYIPAILNTPGMFSLCAPISIAEIPDTSINASAGMMKGDVFEKVGEYDVLSIEDLQQALQKYQGEGIIIDFKRGEEMVPIPVVVSREGKIEVMLANDVSEFNVTKKSYSFFSAIPAGFKKTFSTIGNYVQELGLIFSPKTQAYKSVGSFIAIGKIFPTVWNWEIFWNIIAWLSVMLAVLNLIPIPGLDGGHILFTLYEIITRRKPSDKFLEIAQIIGMIILFALIFLAFGNDIYRLFK